MAKPGINSLGLKVVDDALGLKIALSIGDFPRAAAEVESVLTSLGVVEAALPTALVTPSAAPTPQERSTARAELGAGARRRPDPLPAEWDEAIA